MGIGNLIEKERHVLSSGLNRAADDNDGGTYNWYCAAWSLGEAADWRGRPRPAAARRRRPGYPSAPSAWLVCGTRTNYSCYLLIFYNNLLGMTKNVVSRLDTFLDGGTVKAQ